MNVVVTGLAWSAVLAVPVATAGLVGLGRTRRTRRRTTALASFPLLVAAVPAISLGWTLATDPEPVLGSGANWMRNHGFGRIVDEVEHRWYSEPPSSEPAERLAVNDELLEPGSLTVVLPSASDLATPTPEYTTAENTTPENTTPQYTTSTTTSASTTSTTTPFVPADVAPAVLPPLPDEGRWFELGEPASGVEMWVTSFRPFADAASVTATAVLIDPDGVRFELHNGSELPGGGGWTNGPRIERLDSAVAAFNGGFRFEHIDGGYVTEGRTVEPLADGEATLAIDDRGRMHLGLWGRDLFADGPWVSVRQSLPPIVDDGRNATTGVWSGAWGVDFGNETYVFRSAVCTRLDDRLLYVSAAAVDASMLADVLVALGCRFAMQLDINGNWPQFAVFTGFGTDERRPVLVDRRMEVPMRYLAGSKKDFVAVHAAGADRATDDLDSVGNSAGT